MESLKIRCLTWNVNGHQPPQQQPPAFLDAALGLPTEDQSSIDTITADSADLVVLAFQELDSRPHHFIVDTMLSERDPWTEACYKRLWAQNYVVVESQRMLGMAISLFIHRRHLNDVRFVSCGYNRLGLTSWSILKGAVSIRLDVCGVSLCLIGAHLPAHVDRLNERIAAYHNIVQKLEFKNLQTPKILDHDYAIWLGDLNFRLSDDAAPPAADDAAPPAAQQLIGATRGDDVMANQQPISDERVRAAGDEHAPAAGDERAPAVGDERAPAESSAPAPAQLNFVSVARSVAAGDLAALLERDQLRRARRAGAAFAEFDEAEPITFAPSYKFRLGSNDYDPKRNPAWTDRIMHRCRTSTSSSVNSQSTLNMQQLSYESHEQYTISDHKPVSAAFHFNVFPRGSPELKAFANIIAAIAMMPKSPPSENSYAWVKTLIAAAAPVVLAVVVWYALSPAT